MKISLGPIMPGDSRMQYPCMSSPRLVVGRRSQPGAVYSITTISHGRRKIFSDPNIAAILRRELCRIADEKKIEQYAWMIMPDHLHWVFCLRQGTLAQCLHALKGRSAHRIRQHTKTRGPVWQSGYFDHALRHDESLRRHVRYVVENPLRAHLATAVTDYPHWWCAWDWREV